LWFTSRRDDENACENNAPTVPQPGRTSRPFILPSDGRVAALLPAALVFAAVFAI
jgi:hypothetical protein